MYDLNNILYKFSGTDRVIISDSPEYLQSVRKRFGLMNIGVALFIFIGAFHLISFLMEEHNVLGESHITFFEYVFIFVGALLFSGLVTIFNISMLASNSIVLVFFRVPISFLFSFVFSIPILMALFNQNITDYLRQNMLQTAEYVEKKVKNEKIPLLSSIKLLRKDISALDNKINNYENERSIFVQKVHNEETGNGYGNKQAKCGPNCESFKKQQRQVEEKIELFEKQRQIKSNQLLVSEQKYQELLERKEQKALAKVMEVKRNQSYDFVTKLDALMTMVNEKHLIKVSVLITIMIIMACDLLPLLIKILEEKNSYDTNKDYRNKVNIQKSQGYYNRNKKLIENGTYDKGMMIESYKSQED